MFNESFLEKVTEVFVVQQDLTSASNRVIPPFSASVDPKNNGSKQVGEDAGLFIPRDSTSENQPTGKSIEIERIIY